MKEVETEGEGGKCKGRGKGKGRSIWGLEGTKEIFFF